MTANESRPTECERCGKPLGDIYVHVVSVVHPDAVTCSHECADVVISEYRTGKRAMYRTALTMAGLDADESEAADD